MAYTSIGSNNGTSQTDRALFEKKMSTDVLKYFKDTNVVKALVTVKSIENGKSESFPVVGNTTAQEIANDAAELSIQSIKATEREILIGKMTVAHSWITDIDQAMVHYDNKSAQVESIGRSLAKLVDQKLIEQLGVAASIVDGTSASNAGLLAFGDDIYTQLQTLTESNSLDGSKVYAALAAAMSHYRDQDIVGEPVFLLRPAQYFALLNNPSNTGLTWVNDPYSISGKVPMVLGARVLYSPHFETISSTSGDRNNYGFLFAKEAVGMLELLGVSIRTDYVPTRVSNLITGKMAVGYGVLNHGACIGIGFTVA